VMAFTRFHTRFCLSTVRRWLAPWVAVAALVIACANVSTVVMAAPAPLAVAAPGVRLEVRPDELARPLTQATAASKAKAQKTSPTKSTAPGTEPLGTNEMRLSLTPELQLLVLLTVLSLAPAILVLGTAFTRIVIVLAMVRQALGTPQLPPNQVLIGLSLILTFFVMAPTLQTMEKTALRPFMEGKISQPVAVQRAEAPLRDFMFGQTQMKDLALFIKLAKLKHPKNRREVPTYVLLPAFVISELKTAFQLGFMLFLPFLIIDLAVSSILVSLGMMFLPPATLALPFKLILFVLVDGWHLLCKALVLGFQHK
jgi:flagellar biosynthesis protein FliP